MNGAGAAPAVRKLLLVVLGGELNGGAVSIYHGECPPEGLLSSP